VTAKKPAAPKVSPLERSLRTWKVDANPTVTAQLVERLDHANLAVEELGAVLRVACGIGHELTAIDTLGIDGDPAERRMWAERLAPVIADALAALERLRENT
jgi:hypothetical protein